MIQLVVLAFIALAIGAYGFVPTSNGFSSLNPADVSDTPKLPLVTGFQPQQLKKPLFSSSSPWSQLSSSSNLQVNPPKRAFFSVKSTGLKSKTSDVQNQKTKDDPKQLKKELKKQNLSSFLNRQVNPSKSAFFSVKSTGLQSKTSDVQNQKTKDDPKRLKKELKKLKLRSSLNLQVNPPKSAFFSVKSTGLQSKTSDVQNKKTKDDPKQLKKELKKLELKTKQQTAMIKNLQEMQRIQSANAKVNAKSESKIELDKLTAKVQQQKLTILSLRESLNVSSAKCEKKQEQSRKITYDTVSKLKKCEQKRNASNGIQLVDGCPSSFTNDKEAGICFSILMKMANFENANIDCKNSYNGRLAILNTEAKLNAVRDKLTGKKVRQSVWIGGEQHESNFEWLDGSTISRSFGWAPGEPNDDSERCVDLHYLLEFKMNDERCGTFIAYVCEVPK